MQSEAYSNTTDLETLMCESMSVFAVSKRFVSSRKVQNDCFEMREGVVQQSHIVKAQLSPIVFSQDFISWGAKAEDQQAVSLKGSQSMIFLGEDDGVTSLNIFPRDLNIQFFFWADLYPLLSCKGLNMNFRGTSLNKGLRNTESD